MTGCGQSQDEEQDSDEDGDTDAGDEDAGNLEPAVIHATTSRHDDWLHRGALLADLPWLVYHTIVKSTAPSVLLMPASSPPPGWWSWGPSLKVDALVRSRCPLGVPGPTFKASTSNEGVVHDACAACP